jgi:hypothetical protein
VAATTAEVNREKYYSCPILPGYRTSHMTFATRLSDSSGLSDIPYDIRYPVVRFFRIIGHPARHSLPGCPILPSYRTSHMTFATRLSDSSGISDNASNIHPIKTKAPVLQQRCKSGAFHIVKHVLYCACASF